MFVIIINIPRDIFTNKKPTTRWSREGPIPVSRYDVVNEPNDRFFVYDDLQPYPLVD